MNSKYTQIFSWIKLFLLQDMVYSCLCPAQFEMFPSLTFNLPPHSRGVFNPTWVFSKLTPKKKKVNLLRKVKSPKSICVKYMRSYHMDLIWERHFTCFWALVYEIMIHEIVIWWYSSAKMKKKKTPFKEQFWIYRWCEML